MARRQEADIPNPQLVEILQQITRKVYGDVEDAIPGAVDIKHDGSAIVLPAIPQDMDEEIAAGILLATKAEKEQEVEIGMEFDALPWDGAVAMTRVFMRKFGWAKCDYRTVQTFFGPIKVEPLVHQVPTGPDETTAVLWGSMGVPNTSIRFEAEFNEKRGILKFALSGKCKRRDYAVAQEIFEEIRQELKTNSIYKGKALLLRTKENKIELQLMDDIRFIDPNPTLRDQLVLNKSVEQQVNAVVFGQVENAAAFRKKRIPFRSALLSSTYGVGKSMIGTILADVCVKHNWTYILLPDVRALAAALEMAQTTGLAPAYIVVEDVDRVLRGQRTDTIDKIMNQLDGVTSKGKEVVVLATTNDAKAIPKGVLRPGRLPLINLPLPDSESAQKLLRNYSVGVMDPNADTTEVGELLKGCTPAVIRDCVEYAKAVAVGHGRDQIQPSDVSNAFGVLQESYNAAYADETKEDELYVATRTLGKHMTSSNGAMDQVVKKVNEIHERFFE